MLWARTSDVAQRLGPMRYFGKESSMIQNQMYTQKGFEVVYQGSFGASGLGVTAFNISVNDLEGTCSHC